MNKNKFLDELEESLGKNNVEEINDILAQYEEHFLRKIADGYSEEEIAVKLGNPAEIASQYESSIEKIKSGSVKIPLAIGLGLADIFAYAFFAIAFAWTLVLAVTTVVFCFIGVCLITTPLFSFHTHIIPYMPYFPGILLGVALIALGVLFGVLTVYCFIFAIKLCKAFSRWQKNVWNGKKNLPYSIFPLLENKIRHKLRKVAIAALAVFGILFMIAFITMALSAGNIEFWHVWGWFRYAG